MSRIGAGNGVASAFHFLAAAGASHPVGAAGAAAIFGPGAEYFTGAYMRRAMKRPMMFVGRGRGALAVVYVDDVADLAVVAATHPRAVGEAFNCAIDPPPTHREYLHAYGRLVGNTSYLGFPMSPRSTAFFSHDHCSEQRSSCIKETLLSLF